jgi:NADPH:quinone reductase-like Zn-dependent oxidoreductase
LPEVTVWEHWTTVAASNSALRASLWGSMCERTVAPRTKCLPLPDGIDAVQAAAIVNPGMSAWLSVKERASLQKGAESIVFRT